MSIALIDIGACPRCEMPDFLFVSSHRETSARCLSCLPNQAEETEINAYRELDFVKTTPQCGACFRPAIEGHSRWGLQNSHLKDGTVIEAHILCLYDKTCSACDKQYAHGGRRNWFSPRSESLMALPTIDGYAYTEMHVIYGKDFCTACAQTEWNKHGGANNFFMCDSCSSFEKHTEAVFYSGTRYCQACADENIHECGECGWEYWGSWHNCSVNDDDDDMETPVIHGYSYKPRPVFFGSAPYHMGFELEVESRQDDSVDDDAETVQDMLGNRVYIKHDGSLDNGFEIVTHPHSLTEYQQVFDWSFAKVLRDRGYRSWDTRTCGLHVHVSREAFGTTKRYSTEAQAHQLRFLKLIYDNQRQVQRLAGRESTEYATFNDKGGLVRKVKQGMSNSGHFSAVNTQPSATFEVRVFRGTLRKERVLSALEFVTACVEYTRNLKVTGTNNALSWLRFMAYLSHEAEKYPNLVLITSELFDRDDLPNDSQN